MTNPTFTVGGVGSVAGWTNVGNNPTQSQFGSNVAWTRGNGNYVEQNLGEVIDGGMSYSFQARNGDPAGWGGSYRMSVIARQTGQPDQVLKEVVNGTNANNFYSQKVSVSGAALTGAVGKEIVLRLGGGPSGYNNAGWTDVAVTKQAMPGNWLAPEPLTIYNASFEISNSRDNSQGWGSWVAGTGPNAYGGYAPVSTIGAKEGLNALAASSHQILAGGTNQGLGQFEAGKLYTLSGWFAPRFLNQAGSMFLAAGDTSWIGSQPLSYLDAVSIPGNTQSSWTQGTVSYLATDADQGKFMFIGLQGSFIDNLSLSVQAVPEPGTAWLAGLAAVGVAAARRLRRRPS